MGQVISARPAEPQVSVIIPCYNYARFLGSAVNSLRKQIYQDWEAIIVDDGSIDETEAVASRLVLEDSRVRYVHQRNSGTSEAKNAGIRLARGKYLLFLDADDLITPNKLMAHVEHFEGNPHVDISYSRFRYFKDGCEGKLFTRLDLTSSKEWSKVVDGSYEVSFPVFVRGNNMSIHSAMIRKSLVDKVGFFDVDMHALEDWDYWLRCILRGAYIAFLDDPEAVALTRVHPESATRKLEFSDYMDRVYEKIDLEVGRIRKGGDERLCALINKEMKFLAKRRRNSLFKEKRGEVQARIIKSGLSNCRELSVIVREFGRTNFLKAYLGAMIKRLFTWW
ncbi:poly-beta-1,6 N-acetyl-D-glucosamine synthase [compost metagenome]